MTNSTLDAIKSRRSCRSYLPDQITDEQLDLILEAGLYAPSGMNKQAPVFIAIQDPETIRELSKINTALWKKKGPDAFFGAPTLIAVLSNPHVMHTYKLDAMCCVMNMLQAAESLDLGAACISRAKETFESDYGRALLQKLGIEEGYEGVEHVIVGYRKGEKGAPLPRREGRVYQIRGND